MSLPASPPAWRPQVRSSARRVGRGCALAAALAFAASPVLAQAPAGHLVVLCSGDGPATILLFDPPSDGAPDQPAKPTCAHALCSRSQLSARGKQTGRSPA